MARTFRLALAQLNLTVGDLPGNTARMVEYLHLARESGADLVAFPELATTGYPPEDLLFKKSFIEANVAAMEQVVAESRGIAVVLGYVQPRESGIANSAAIGYDGRLMDTYDKIILPNYGVFDEERYFTKGRVCPVYEIGGVRVGVNVCEDIWYEVGPSAVQRQAGAELIVSINGSPFHAGKSRYRRKKASLAAAPPVTACSWSYLNTVGGGQDELVFDGNSMICDPCGKVVARGPAFREAMILADIDVDSVSLHLYSSAPTMITKMLCPLWVFRSRFTFQATILGTERPPLCCPSEDCGEIEEVEEIYRALVLGTRDYLHKTGFRKAIVGLSGGIDSALTAVIAADALGPENVLGITMPSRYSSQGQRRGLGGTGA